MPSRIAVIVNIVAGLDDKQGLAKMLTDTFGSAGIDGRVVIVRSGGQVREAALRAVKERPQAIVAAGGDGTINAVAATLIGTDISLGILPLGTLNHFAKDLHIPLEVGAAVRNVIAGHVTRVDVGEVNDRIFLNNSSLGIYPTIVLDREQQQRLGRGKWTAFIWAVLTVMRRHTFFDVQVAANSQERSRRTPFVFIGNNEYQMEGFTLGERRSLNAGQLSVYMVNHPRRWGLLRLALRSLFGRLHPSRDFDAFCAAEVDVKTRHKHMRVALDGEVTVMIAPLHYRVHPGALRVIVPESIASAGG